MRPVFWKEDNLDETVIVGGVAGGARQLRGCGLDESAEIVMFERESTSPLPTAACPITSAGRLSKSAPHPANPRASDPGLTWMCG